MTDTPMNSPVAVQDEPNVEVEQGTPIPWLAVYKRELGQYFRSPIAYGVAFAILFFLGLLFNGYIAQAVAANASGQSQIPADSTYAPGLLTFLMFLIAPLLTMRLLAEESREGTLEVLMTMPMNEAQFIIGKFLAAWTYYTVLLLITLSYHLILLTVGNPDLGSAFGAYVGAWLYGGAVLAITMIWSAVTEDQIVAAFLGAATVLVLYLADIAAAWIGGQSSGTSSALADLVREIGLQAHYDSTLARGIVRAEDILYFIFMIVGALFITVRIVETRRWRS
ncbi:MAG: ABC transporter permease subunit [Chloroflexi bacterium]|nr:ABC transporter permease subunit [Chloroflexota bacterium]